MGPQDRCATRHALVTGGAGFIGSHLVDALLSDGRWRVTVIDNFDDFYSPEIKRANISAHRHDERFKLYETDICDREALRDIFARSSFDCIVHLAARAGVRPSLESPAAYIDTNITGTLNLLECAKDFGIGHLVFGSSSSIYGLNAELPFSEEDRTFRPISPYAASKASGELMCHTYSHLYGIRCVCLRFFTVYGARQRPDLAIHKFARLISSGRPIPVFGDGTSRRDYTYIGDIIQGVCAAMEFRDTGYEIINLGESQTIELKRLIRLLEDNLGQGAIIDRKEMQPGDVQVTFADISKAKTLLKYDPQTQIEEGISRFVEWFLGDKSKNKIILNRMW